MVDALLLIAAIVVILGIFTSAPKNILLKAKKWSECMTFFVLAKDGKKPKNLRPLMVQMSKGRRVKVIFVRHGESVWNSLFNKFDVQWPIRVVTSSLLETLLWLSDPYDSCIIDSPLSRRGRKQASELEQFVKSDAGRSQLPLDTKTSIVVSSNLRRAMETAVIGLGPRIIPNREKIFIDSSLQEGSRNADAIAFCSGRGTLTPTNLHGMGPDALQRAFDPKYNQGNKSIKGNVFARIDDFCLRLFGEAPSSDQGTRAFSTVPEGTQPNSIIVVGHSLWFKNFFNRFLPQSSDHISKKKKMQNCAAVGFEIYADATTGEVMIDESTIKPLFKTFG